MSSLAESSPPAASSAASLRTHSLVPVHDGQSQIEHADLGFEAAPWLGGSTPGRGTENR